jgi:hypothetical protein
MTKFCVALALIFSVPALAHDEGHGPKLTDVAKQGGVVSPVIDAKEASKGAKATVVHKAELVRSEDGTVRVYFYDQGMNPLDLSKFSKEAKGVLEFKKNKKWVKAPFVFKQEENAFIAMAPKSESKPFNIDIHVREAGKELLAAFDNLD